MTNDIAVAQDDQHPARPAGNLSIDYRPPVDERPQVSLDTGRWLLRASFVPPVVGLLIVGLAWFDESNTAAFFGMLWLGVGGLVTLVVTACAIAGWAGTFSRSGDVKRGRRLFGATLLMGGVSVATGIGCTLIGGVILSMPSFRVAVKNNTTQAVDVVFHFDGGDVAVGPIPAGQVGYSAGARNHHSGRLDMTVTSGGQSRRTLASDYEDEDSLGGMEYQPIEVNTLPSHGGIP